MRARGLRSDQQGPGWKLMQALRSGRDAWHPGVGLECGQQRRLGLGPGAGLGVGLVLSPLSPQSGGSDQERSKKKRRGDRYSVQTSLIVATLKKMLPIGLNMCAPTDQELIMQAKNRYALVPAQPPLWEPAPTSP